MYLGHGYFFLLLEQTSSHIVIDPSHLNGFCYISKVKLHGGSS